MIIFSVNRRKINYSIDLEMRYTSKAKYRFLSDPNRTQNSARITKANLG